MFQLLSKLILLLVLHLILLRLALFHPFDFEAHLLQPLRSLLTATGVFDKIAKVAGAGTAVPISGFANSIVSAALEFQTEGRILGTAAQMFTIAGPVIVFGCSSASLYGLIIYLFGLY